MFVHNKSKSCCTSKNASPFRINHFKGRHRVRPTLLAEYSTLYPSLKLMFWHIQSLLLASGSQQPSCCTKVGWSLTRHLILPKTSRHCTIRALPRHAFKADDILTKIYVCAAPEIQSFDVRCTRIALTRLSTMYQIVSLQSDLICSFDW